MCRLTMSYKLAQDNSAAPINGEGQDYHDAELHLTCFPYSWSEIGPKETRIL